MSSIANKIEEIWISGTPTPQGIDPPIEEQLRTLWEIDDPSPALVATLEAQWRSALDDPGFRAPRKTHPLALVTVDGTPLYLSAFKTTTFAAKKEFITVFALRADLAHPGIADVAEVSPSPFVDFVVLGTTVKEWRDAQEKRHQRFLAQELPPRTRRAALRDAPEGAVFSDPWRSREPVKRVFSMVVTAPLARTAWETRFFWVRYRAWYINNERFSADRFTLPELQDKIRQIWKVDNHETPIDLIASIFKYSPADLRAIASGRRRFPTPLEIEEMALLRAFMGD